MTKDEFILKIIELTKNNKMTWILVSPYNLNFVENKQNVVRAIYSTYNGDEFYFIETKEMFFYDEYNIQQEEIRSTIYILNNNLLQMRIYPQELNEYTRMTFYETVQTKIEDSFFEKYK